MEDSVGTAGSDLEDDSHTIKAPEYGSAIKIPVGALDQTEGSHTPIAAREVVEKDGNLYGTTSGLGVLTSTVYKITLAGVLTTLHTLTSSEGSYLQGGLVQGTDGNFYGDSNYGGTASNGMIFKITSAGKHRSSSRRHRQSCAERSAFPKA